MSVRGSFAVFALLLLQSVAPARPAPPLPAAATSLDGWIALHYRGAHLLPDTSSVSPSMASSGTPPRIETIQAGVAFDTIWAVHFSANGQLPTFAVPATVRLTGPTGAVTPLAARVVARRPFRAPRVPGGPATAAAADSNWRQGWAYIAVLPHDATRNAARYRGWLLLGVPERASTRPRPK